MERNKALDVWAAIGGSGAAAGVLLDGVLTDGPGWQWVFYVNVPVGLLVLAAVPTVVGARAPRPVRVDAPVPTRDGQLRPRSCRWPARRWRTSCSPSPSGRAWPR
ncbi:MFS transporter [Streptomyces sp. DT2A-34]|uniref:MFS transporter n=1 Tax=Streptomyces sp. DT2A-34 TaxID=3051182 RepID=UPI00265C0D80|nr:MFS transporter [Streptomyces sp. DT2A-34]MDO0911210.1 MFS transporter [Streptomyces sp. DT2A-34]